MNSPTTQPGAEALQAYGRAHRLQRAVVAAYSTRIAAADERTADELRQRRHQVLVEQQTLSELDTARVREICEAFPALLMSLREDDE
jgi:tellurite resistance protein